MYFFVLILGYVFQLFNKRVLFYIFAAFLGTLAFLRYGIGLDYFAYEFLYNRLQPSVIDEIRYGYDNQEIGFRIIGAFFKSLGLTYQQYLMVFAAVNLAYIIKICKRFSVNPTLSLLIFFSFYYLTWTFSGIRQGVVISVGLYYLLTCIENKQPKRFIAIVLMLSLIHSSALVLLLLYFVSSLNIGKSKLVSLSILSIIFSILPTGLIINKLSWLPFYHRIFPYLDTGFSLNFLDFQSIGRIVFLLVALYFYNVFSEQGSIYKKIINMYIFSLALYFFMQFSEATAARLSIYGKFLDILILSNVLYLFRTRLDKLIYIASILVLSLTYLSKEAGEIKRATNSESFNPPYVNIFNKEDYNFYKTFDIQP